MPLIDWNDLDTHDRRELLESLGTALANNPKQLAKMTWDELPEVTARAVGKALTARARAEEERAATKAARRGAVTKAYVAGVAADVHTYVDDSANAGTDTFIPGQATAHADVHVDDQARDQDDIKLPATPSGEDPDAGAHPNADNTTTPAYPSEELPGAGVHLEATNHLPEEHLAELQEMLDNDVPGSEIDAWMQKRTTDPEATE